LSDFLRYRLVDILYRIEEAAEHRNIAFRRRRADCFLSCADKINSDFRRYLSRLKQAEPRALGEFLLD